MTTRKIALIPGDGIGPEVVAEGVKVLKTIEHLDENLSFEFTTFPWGCEYYLEHGRMMDENGLKQLKEFDAIYLGAVGHPSVPDHISLWELLLRIRKGFEQYVNLRPITLLNSSLTPIKSKSEKDIDFLVIREKIVRGSMQGKGIGFLEVNRKKLSCKRVCFPVKGPSGLYAMHLKKLANRRRR